jgi:hypothetical protein
LNPFLLKLVYLNEEYSAFINQVLSIGDICAFSSVLQVLSQLLRLCIRSGKQAWFFARLSAGSQADSPLPSFQKGRL